MKKSEHSVSMGENDGQKVRIIMRFPKGLLNAEANLKIDRILDTTTKDIEKVILEDR